MSFNGTEGKPISIGIAKQWVKNWRDANPGKVEAIFFGKEKLRELIDETGSVGIRVYFAIDDNDAYKLVLVGAGADGGNILPEGEGKDGGGTILDDGKPCPPDCPPNNL